MEYQTIKIDYLMMRPSRRKQKPASAILYHFDIQQLVKFFITGNSDIPAFN